MKTPKKLALFVGGLIAVSSLSASATEVLKWNGSPLDIQLAVNQQRLVRLPDNVMFRFPQTLSDQLHVSSAAGVLYITANDVLDNVPLEARLASTGEVIKMQLTSSDDQTEDTADDVRVVLPWESVNLAQASNDGMPVGVQDSVVNNDADNGDHYVEQHQVTPNEFIRYAAMRDFMPKRLWRTDSRIQDLKTTNAVDLSQLFYGQSTGVFDAKIQSSYKSGDEYLYVIALKNKMPFPVDIRFDDISVDFKYASVPEPYYALGKVGTVSSFSYLYLITTTDIKTLISNVDPYANVKGQEK
ncbi:DUF3438 family protein [Photobacterium leiognathi]|uniref:DUF3438 family protein n=1 Tax=Photobacterium leiognathi TaxID=553611 RepID=UPI002981C7CA|nr:DUF3438 family protein [Photobacterium leiognathi]